MKAKDGEGGWEGDKQAGLEIFREDGNRERDREKTTHEPCTAQCPDLTEQYTNKVFLHLPLSFTGHATLPLFEALPSITQCGRNFVS